MDPQAALPEHALHQRVGFLDHRVVPGIGADVERLRWSRVGFGAVVSDIMPHSEKLTRRVDQVAEAVGRSRVPKPIGGDVGHKDPARVDDAEDRIRELNLCAHGSEVKVVHGEHGLLERACISAVTSDIDAFSSLDLTDQIY